METLRRWRVTAATALTAVLAGVSAGPAHADPRRYTFSYTIAGERVFPEGVVADQARGVFYVSSAYDGTIYRGRAGHQRLEVFLPGGADGRTQAQGLRLDPRGRLYVAGGATGQMWVYDTRTRSLVRRFDTGLREDVLVNDVALDPAGNAYFTDSRTPVLWRLPAGQIRPSATPASAERFLDLTRTTVRYQEGFNLNGIALAPGRRSLLTVQSNTGKLFAIALPGGRVTEVPVEQGPLTGGDGLTFTGKRLVVTRSAPDRLDTLTLGTVKARVVHSYTDTTFRFPTTAALLYNRLLVVNAQLDQDPDGQPELPFSVSAVPLEKLG
ncbi:SMP-30/gluconolactonase/LRE family protein [Nonomuraea sp. FMUSA5-5]|uniref:SMP-30/gluconolactonase/LRE family protein n=1 Tax=Nonomuraea composti TaxID=2720023 RepID=A0ABX1BAI6_9ACTN|nr:SMP-30/gluconolactonase/LRE family protein [Nonomuraea sp. FMUSA5-5]